MNQTSHKFTRTDSHFDSGGTTCRGWLYMPIGVENPPVIVMAHGFAAEKCFKLPDYAEHFAGEGFAVYMFDYRNFGESDGKPRNLVDPMRHNQDWYYAVAHVRTLPGVNHKKIGLWGSSLSGGHVIIKAGQDPNISAIAIQVPFVDSLSTIKMVGISHALKGTVAAIRDLIFAALRQSPHYIPVVGKPDTFAVMNSPESYSGYYAIIPEGSTWKNECPARIMLTLMLYRPTCIAHRITCPALVVVAEKDSLICPEAAKQAARKMKNARLETIPGGHFDVYEGEHYNRILALQTEHFKKHLF